MSEDTTRAVNPAAVPQPFTGYTVAVEYADSLPAAGSPLAAVRTPHELVLAFVRRMPKGRLRLDAFDGRALPLYFDLSEVEVVGLAVLTPRAAGRRAA